MCISQPEIKPVGKTVIKHTYLYKNTQVVGVYGGIRPGSEVKVSQTFLIRDILLRPVAAVQGSVHAVAV